MTSEMEELFEYKTLKHFYSVIVLIFNRYPEINSIKDCIEVSKLITRYINQIMFKSGLLEWLEGDGVKKVAKHNCKITVQSTSSPQKIFFQSLACISVYLKNGDETMHKLIKYGCLPHLLS